MGGAAVALLWDVKGFFDSIDLPTLVKEAKLLNFPRKLLGLSLALHLAPRASADKDHTHPELLLPGMSSLAGSIHSFMPAKAPHHPSLGGVVQMYLPHLSCCS